MNQGLLHYRQILCQLSYQGTPPREAALDQMLAERTLGLRLCSSFSHERRAWTIEVRTSTRTRQAGVRALAVQHKFLHFALVSCCNVRMRLTAGFVRDAGNPDSWTNFKLKLCARPKYICRLDSWAFSLQSKIKDCAKCLWAFPYIIITHGITGLQLKVERMASNSLTAAFTKASNPSFH